MEWSVVDLKNSKRMSGAGHPLEDPELEKLLLKFMKELKEDKQQFVSPLLVMEALFHKAKLEGWCGQCRVHGKGPKLHPTFSGEE